MSSLISSLFGVGARADASTNAALDDRYYPELAGAYGRMSPELALKVAAVYRCVSIRANTLAMLPLGVYEDQEGDGEEGSKRRAPEHPMDYPLRLRPNPRQTSYEWKRQLSVSLLLRSNAYCQMVPAGPGVFDLIPLHPDRVSKPELLPSGRVRYTYTRPSGEQVPLYGGESLWHLQGLSEDGIRGLDTMDLAGDSFKLAATAERHALKFFEKGVKPTVVLQNDKTLTREVAEEMGDSFGRRYGGESGVGKVPVLWEGTKIQPIQMTLKDAEFLDSRKFSVNDIARRFGVPPHLAGDVEKTTSWGTGIEEQTLNYLVYTTLPDIALWEQRIRHDLLVNPERFFARFNINAILRATSKVRYEVYQIAITNGILSPNDCRRLEDMNPREGGDVYVTPTAPQQSRGGGPEEPETGAELGPEGEKAAIALANRLAAELDRPAAKATAAAEERARRLARAAARVVAGAEISDLTALAGKVGDNRERWLHGVASFYGRHASRVADALAIDEHRAKEYCRSRQAEAATGLDLTEDAVLDKLVALAVAG